VPRTLPPRQRRAVGLERAERVLVDDLRRRVAPIDLELHARIGADGAGDKDDAASGQRHRPFRVRGGERRQRATLRRAGVLLGCYWGVIIPRCYWGVTGVLPVCYRCVTGVLQGCYWGVIEVILGCDRSVTY